MKNLSEYYSYYDVDSAEEEFDIAIHRNNIDKIKVLLTNVDKFSEGFLNYCLRYSSEKGHLEIVKELLADGRADPTDAFNGAFVLAAKNNNVDILEELLKDSRVDPTDNNFRAFIYLSTLESEEMLITLMNDYRTNQREFLDWATRNGADVILKLALKNLDIKTGIIAGNNEYATKYIKNAAYNGHTETVKLLLNDERIIRGLKDTNVLHKLKGKGNTLQQAIIDTFDYIKNEEDIRMFISLL